MQDKWFYVFKHLHELDDIPTVLQETVFLNLFQVAQIAQFQPSERKAYENSLKYYRDLKNVTDSAHGKGVEEGFEQGPEKGIEQGREVIAQNMLKAGLSVGQIAQLTGLTELQIERLG